MSDLERFSISVDAGLLERFDALLERAGNRNRSEAIRDLIRGRLVEADWSADGDGECVATLTLVYDHHRRELVERLVGAGHGHAAAALATLHVHLDADHCLEVTALRGRPADLRAFADQLLSLKGVVHGQLVMTSARA